MQQTGALPDAGRLVVPNLIRSRLARRRAVHVGWRREISIHLKPLYGVVQY